MSELEAALVESVRRARAEPETLAYESSERYGYPAGFLARYFEKLRYRFGPRERAGLYTFLELAQEVGELERVPELRFVAEAPRRPEAVRRAARAAIIGGMEEPVREELVADLTLRVAELDLTLREVVAALGMLVSELATRDDLALSQPEVVEHALERAWAALGAPAPTSEARRAPAWADAARLAALGPDALGEAVAASGAAVGALYAVGASGLHLVASVGYPDGVMEEFADFPPDAALPAAEAARTRRPIWFDEREAILRAYPHLRDAHEQTEEALAQTATQGAVIPLLHELRPRAVVIIGFTAAFPGGRPLWELRERIERSLDTP